MDAGEIAIEVIAGRARVTVAEADFVLSALLVAVTVTVPAVPPAVKRPADDTAPPDADQVTDLSVTVPCTVAVNCCVASVRMLAVAGVTETEVTIGALTVTDADAVLVGSATLVAVTITVPPLAGAVSKPALVIEPPEVDHVTALFVTVP